MIEDSLFAEVFPLAFQLFQLSDKKQ